MFAVGYRSDDVESFFGTAFGGVPVEYAHRRTRAGTADAVATAGEHVDGAFAVRNGDNVYDPPNLSTLFEQGPTVGYTRIDDPSPYGVVSTDGETVTGVGVDGWADVAYPWDLLSTNERALASIERTINGDVHQDATLCGRVAVEAGVMVEGPVLIRRSATIGPNASVRMPAVVRPDAALSHAVEITNSLLLEGASANHLSSVGDSILGPVANLSAGTVTANLRHDDEPVLAGDDRSTDRRKFGAVMAPSFKTGLNTNLQPVVIFSTDALTKPGEVAYSDR